MSIQVQINSTDRSEFVLWESLTAKQQLTNLVDTCSFLIRKNETVIPAYGDDLKIFDGAEQIFGGTILKVEEETQSIGEKGIIYKVSAVDYSYEMDRLMVAKTYKNKTISEIIIDILSNYAPDFNADNVESNFLVSKIVFNQIPTSQCLKRLADIVRYDWYVDENKSIHFFEKNSNSAPYDLTDTSGNYVYLSLKRTIDGSQVVNRVKVRGGEYEGELFTDSITVSGNSSKSFKLPYKMANLSVSVNTVAKTVGVDFLEDFTTKEVLHNYQDQSFRFETALSDGDVIEFSGNPKVRVFAIAEDPASREAYGVVEKLVRENSIQDNTTARRRAAAELYAYADKLVDAKFTTYSSGLRAGMKINVQSDNRGSDDDLIIKTLTFKTIDSDTFIYEVECVSTKRIDLISLLAKILEPESMDIDESEVSEQIFADTAEVTITEEIEFVSPQEDNAELTITENIQFNPFDPNTINWVWGYYVPTSDTDVNRMWKWSRDSKWS